MTTTFAASITETGALIELVMLTPSKTRRTSSSDSVATTICPSESVPLSR